RPRLHTFPTRRSSDLAEDAGELGDRDHAVRDAGLENRAPGVVLVEVRGIEVTGDLPELLHVAVADGVFEPELIADVELIECLARSEEHTSELQSPDHL